MSIYYLPPGCVFREDFINPGTVAANGGVITGAPYIKDGITPLTSNSCKIVYPKTKGLLCNSITSTLCVSLITPSDVTNVTDIVASFESAGKACRFSSYIVSGRYYTSFFPAPDGAGAPYVTCLLSANTKYTFITSYDGNTPAINRAIIYANGIKSGATSGTIPTRLVYGSSPFSILSQEISGLRSIAGAKISTVQLYSTAFTATDALDWHRMAMETY